MWLQLHTSERKFWFLMPAKQREKLTTNTFIFFSCSHGSQTQNLLIHSSSANSRRYLTPVTYVFISESSLSLTVALTHTKYVSLYLLFNLVIWKWKVHRSCQGVWEFGGDFVCRWRKTTKWKTDWWLISQGFEQVVVTLADVQFPMYVDNALDWLHNFYTPALFCCFFRFLLAARRAWPCCRGSICQTSMRLGALAAASPAGVSLFDFWDFISTVIGPNCQRQRLIFIFLFLIYYESVTIKKQWTIGTSGSCPSSMHSTSSFKCGSKSGWPPWVIPLLSMQNPIWTSAHIVSETQDFRFCF